MRVYRCFAEGPLTPGATVPLHPDEAHHLLQVRRARAGDGAIVVNGRGIAAEGVLVVEGKRGSVAVGRILREDPEPAPVIVACALTKSSAFEDILQRAVELGMTRFVPLITERTVVEYDDRRAEKKLEKWSRHAMEALKQCERTWLPTFEAPTPLAEILKDAQRSRLLFLEERTGDIPLLGTIAPGITGAVTLLIGPEGGWTDDEKRAARDAGAEPISLGTASILRAETAWLAALSILTGTSALTPRAPAI